MVQPYGQKGKIPTKAIHCSTTSNRKRLETTQLPITKDPVDKLWWIHLMKYLLYFKPRKPRTNVKSSHWPKIG